MQQTELPFFEGPEDALKDAVQHLGGAKAVGKELWPDKSVDTAQRLLLDCLNTSRAEKLELSQILMILRLAKEAGCHAPMRWLAAEVGYDAIPISKAEQDDRLAAAIEGATKELAGLLKRAEATRK